MYGNEELGERIFVSNHLNLPERYWLQTKDSNVKGSVAKAVVDEDEDDEQQV